jgi:hypothetical protein
VELSDLLPVLSAQGPFVTVHVGAESAVEQAADRYELAWKSLLGQLEEADVPEPVRTALYQARGAHDDGNARLVVADLATGAVLLSEPVSTRPTTDEVSVAPLPRLLPLLTDLTARVPHVVVLADRTGADVAAYFDVDRTAREVTVKGRTLHLKKVQVGGWAHHRYQHRSENAWKENGEDIADTVVQLAGQVGAELVIAIGDEREVTMVEKALPQQWQGKYLALPGGRGQDGSEELVQQRVRDALALHVATETLTLLGQFAQERGQAKRACDGVEDVVQALRKAQVQTLLLTTELTGGGGGTLFYGPDPAVLGTTAEEVASLGVDDPKQAPAVDVLVRAAIGTAADVQIVPHEPKEAPNGGVGAVLRYADDDNAAARGVVGTAAAGQ